METLTPAPVIFETSRLLVRRYTELDGEHFFALNGDPEVVRYIRPAKTRPECDVFLEEVIDAYKTAPLFGRWAAERRDDGHFIGSFALIPVDGTDRMQLGYSLLPGEWGKGYATELSVAGLGYCFRNTPLCEIWAYTEEANKPSQQVLLKAGFRYIETRRDEKGMLVEFHLSRDEWERTVELRK